MSTAYTSNEPMRTDVDAMEGPVVIEFGAPWCGHCLTAQPLVATALAGHPGVRHIKVEDGRGRPLGRSFRVKLWPTLIFLRDGKEEARVVRPDSTLELRDALGRIDR